MKTIDVEITGTSPLLMHRFSEQDRSQVLNGTSHATQHPSPEDAAEVAAYRMASTTGRGNLFFPVEGLLAALRAASTYRKIGRRSAKAAVSGGVMAQPLQLDFGTTEYVIDSRSVVIPATKGRIMRHRPRLDNWRLRFKLEYDERVIPSGDFVRQVLEDAGTLVGLGDFRPQRGGPCGRFVVTGWK